MTNNGSDRIPERLTAAWEKHRFILLKCAVGFMACLAVLWLGYEILRFFTTPKMLLGRRIVYGGLDLKLMYDFTGQWFSGVPIYKNSILAVYPPASYVIVWPLVGWTDFFAARLLWTGATAVSLAFLVMVFARSSGAGTTPGRMLTGLIPLATYPAGAVIGNGQFTILVMASLISALMLLARAEASWKTDILASLLFLVALIKPHISAPFFWIALFVPGRIRPALLITGGYCALSLFASSLQESDIISLFSNWLSRASFVASQAGYSNAHKSLAQAGLGDYGLGFSLAILALSGIIIFYCRRADFWTLMGLTAIFARIWTYHWWFDDLLVIPAIIALMRTANSAEHEPAAKWTAALLAGLCTLLMLAPGGHYTLSYPLRGQYISFLTLVWSAILVFLSLRALKEARAACG